MWHMILCCLECSVFILGNLKGLIIPSLQDEGVNPAAAAAAAVRCFLKDMNPPHLLISALGNSCT